MLTSKVNMGEVRLVVSFLLNLSAEAEPLLTVFSYSQL